MAMLPLVGLTMPDWSRVRGQTKDSPWPSRLGVWRGFTDPTAVKIYGYHGAKLTYFFVTFPDSGGQKRNGRQKREENY